MKERTSFDNLEGVLQRGRRGLGTGGLRERLSEKEEKSSFSTLPRVQVLARNVFRCFYTIKSIDFFACLLLYNNINFFLFFNPVFQFFF